MRNASRATKWKIIAVIVVLAAAAVRWIKPVLDERNAIATAIQWGNLAPIPNGATQVHAYRNEAFTWSRVWVTFHAPPDEIDAFLKSSPGLNGITPEIFTPKHMYLPRSLSHTDDDLMKNKYFRDDEPRLFHLAWFNPTIKERGRVFDTSGKNDVTIGYVAVDDVHNVVFIDFDSN